MPNKLLIFLGIIGIIIIAAVLVVFGIYNGLVSGGLAVDEKWAQVETQYQRRVDLIPNLVATVKGAATFEQSTFEKITSLRSQWSASATSAEKVDVANQIEGELSRLIAVFENYPALTATQAYRDLMTQLEGTENRVAFARGEYNTAVRDYNTKVKTIPSNIVAGMFGFKERAFFQGKPGSENVPTVDFG